MLIYHILRPDVWTDVKQKKMYEAESLKTEGFIHCSLAGQVDGVLGRYFADAGEVVILTIDAERLTSPLLNEASTNDEHFPHVYGPIDLDAVINAEIRDVRNTVANFTQLADA